MIDRAPQFLTFQTKKSVNRPVIAVQVVATTYHTSLSLYLPRNEHVIQLKEATLVGVFVRPTRVMIPLNARESEVVTQVEGAQSWQTKGMHALSHSFPPTRRRTVCMWMNSGTCQTFKTWGRLTFRSDPITILEVR